MAVPRAGREIGRHVCTTLDTEVRPIFHRADTMRGAGGAVLPGQTGATVGTVRPVRGVTRSDGRPVSVDRPARFEVQRLAALCRTNVATVSVASRRMMRVPAPSGSWIA